MASPFWWNDTRRESSLNLHRYQNFTYMLMSHITHQPQIQRHFHNNSFDDCIYFPRVPFRDSENLPTYLPSQTNPWSFPLPTCVCIQQKVSDYDLTIVHCSKVWSTTLKKYVQMCFIPHILCLGKTLQHHLKHGQACHTHLVTWHVSTCSCW